MKRLFRGAAPAFLLTITATSLMAQGTPTYEPLNERERVQLYLKSLVNPVSILSSSVSAGIGQWRDRPEEWGQGGEGFGRRFASSFAGHIVRQSITLGVSSVLHEDNRFVRMGPGNSTTSRIRHALVTTFQARHDDGSWHVSYSKIAGLTGSAFISRAWQPPSSDGWGGAASSIGVNTAVGAGFQVAREFLPDL